MALYVAICLLAAFAALPETDAHARVIGIIWGVTVGLALAHWFAFRVSARMVGVGSVRPHDVESAGVQLVGAAGWRCSPPFLCSCSRVDRVGARGVVAGRVHRGRWVRGRPWRWGDADKGDALRACRAGGRGGYRVGEERPGRPLTPVPSRQAGRRGRCRGLRMRSDASAGAPSHPYGRDAGDQHGRRPDLQEVPDPVDAAGEADPEQGGQPVAHQPAHDPNRMVNHSGMASLDGPSISQTNS
jgi:hypothetical protein